MPSLGDFIAVKNEISDRYLSAELSGSPKTIPANPELGLALLAAFPANPILVAAAAREPKPIVHAMGVGRKQVDGKSIGELCIRFYVVKKLTESILSPSARLPESIDGMPTDVIESPPAIAAGNLPPCSNKRKTAQRPLIGGISIGHKGITAGTLGYFCTSRLKSDDRKSIYVLSNNHVIANSNMGIKGDAVLQPGRLDGGADPRDQVAKLWRFKKLKFMPNGTNDVDAAIAQRLKNIEYTPAICGIGKVTGVTKAKEDMEVAKHGRSSELTSGKVTDISVNPVITGLDPRNPRARARFSNQIRVESEDGEDFADTGDSGSLVVTRGRRPEAVGLLFACPEGGGYALLNPIDLVLRQLKIKLV
jgi:hypothetical protein